MNSFDKLWNTVDDSLDKLKSVAQFVQSENSTLKQEAIKFNALQLTQNNFVQGLSHEEIKQNIKKQVQMISDLMHQDLQKQQHMIDQTLKALNIPHKIAAQIQNIQQITPNEQVTVNMIPLVEQIQLIDKKVDVFEALIAKQQIQHEQSIHIMANIAQQMGKQQKLTILNPKSDTTPLLNMTRFGPYVPKMNEVSLEDRQFEKQYKQISKQNFKRSTPVQYQQYSSDPAQIKKMVNRILGIQQ